jgi:C4-dicarboxylate transporter DctM subunit
LLHKLAKAASRVGEIGGAFFMFALTLTMMLQVFCRKILNNSLSWSDEFGSFMLVWLTMFASVACLYEDKHLAITALVERARPPWDGLIRIAAHILTFLFLLALLVWGVPMAAKTMGVFTISLSVPKGLIYSVLPFDAALMCLVLVDKIAQEAAAMRGKRKGG